MTAGYRIRRLQREEIPLLTGWAADEGWNPGLHDAEAFHAADPQGFWVGEWQGEAVAGISLVQYDTRYAFLGLYIVKPEYRGRGHGLALWQHAMQQLGDTVCGLDGVPAQVANYRRTGFQDAYPQQRFRAQGISGQTASSVQTATAADWPALLAYDTAVFGADRHTFLRAWLGMPNARGFLVRRNGNLHGYAVLRRCGEGHKIGPLFADNPHSAEQLFLACCQAAGNEPVFLDIPDINPEAQALARHYNLEPVFDTLRMYRNGRHRFPVQKVYGVTSFELG